MKVKRFRSLTLVASLGILALFLIFLSTNQVAAQGPPGPPGNLAVTVTNTPLPVTDVDKPVRHVFQQGASQTDTTGGANLLLGFSVPSNKLLVIETISIQADVPVGQTVTA